MPTAHRAPTALLVRRGGERLLFDCAEGTQRQLLRSSLGLVDLREIFLTHYHADHYLGLPGMLKTFALRGRDAPITIYGPPGLARPVRRAAAVFGRLTYRLRARRAPPGRRARSATTTGSSGLSASSTARRSVGYALVEDDRPGRFDVATADALGVPVGPGARALQRGEAVTLADGRRSRPTRCVGAPRPGRTVVISGDTAPCDAVLEAAPRRRPAGPRGDVPRGRARSARPRRCTRPPSTRPSSRAAPGSSCSR